MQLMQSMQFMHLMQFMQGGRRTHAFICRRGSQNSTICRCGVAERINNLQKKISAYILFRPPIQCVGFTPLRTHIHFKWSLRVRTRGSTATANMSGGIKLCNWSSQVTKSPRLGSSHSLHYVCMSVCLSVCLSPAYYRKTDFKGASALFLQNFQTLSLAQYYIYSRFPDTLAATNKGGFRTPYSKC